MSRAREDFAPQRLVILQTSAVARQNGQPRQAEVARGVRGHGNFFIVY